MGQAATVTRLLSTLTATGSRGVRVTTARISSSVLPATLSSFRFANGNVNERVRDVDAWPLR